MGQWGYVLYFPDLDRYSSFGESDLRSTGEIDTEETHRGKRFEISYVLDMGDDMKIVEGSYRLPGQFWQIFLFANEDVPELRHHFGTWQSGITGVEFKVPIGIPINRDFIVRAMSEVFGADSWTEVDGPDSLAMK